MARALHVRLDDDADADLRTLESADGLSASVAVRTALHEAAQRRRSRASLAEVARRLAADPVDRAEVDEVRQLMDELAPADLAD